MAEDHALDPAGSDLSDAVTEVFDNEHLSSDETQPTTDSSEEGGEFNEEQWWDEEEWDGDDETGTEFGEAIDVSITSGWVSAIVLLGCLVACIAMTLMRVNKLWAPALPETPAMFIEALDQVGHFLIKPLTITERDLIIEPLTITERDLMIDMLSHEQLFLEDHKSLIDFGSACKGSKGATYDLLWKALTLSSRLKTTINALKLIPVDVYAGVAFDLAQADFGIVWLKNQTTSRPLTQVSRDLDRLRRASIPGIPTLRDVTNDRVKALRFISDDFALAFRTLHMAIPLITVAITQFKEKACENKPWEMAGSLLSVRPEYALLYLAVKNGKAALESACRLADQSSTRNAKYAELPKILLNARPSYDIPTLQESAEGLHEMIREERRSGKSDEALAGRVDQEMEAIIREHERQIRAVKVAFLTF